MEIKPLFTPEQARQLSDSMDQFITNAFVNLQANLRAAFPFMFEDEGIPDIDASKISVINTEGDKVAEYDYSEIRDGANNVLAYERTNRATGETTRITAGGSDSSEPISASGGSGRPFGPGRCQKTNSDFNIYANGETGDHLDPDMPIKGEWGAPVNGDTIPVQLENGPVTFHPLGDDGIVHLNERSLDRIYGAFARQEGELHPIARRALEPLAAVQAELQRMSYDCHLALRHVHTMEERTKLIERLDAYDTAVAMIKKAMPDA